MLFALAINLAAAAPLAPPSPEQATISSGGIFTSTTGEPVHAHGAGIIIPDSHPAGAGGKYYMVGATQKTQPGWLSEGINMYSSYDLQHWKFEVRPVARPCRSTTACYHRHRKSAPTRLKARCRNYSARDISQHEHHNAAARGRDPVLPD